MFRYTFFSFLDSKISDSFLLYLMVFPVAFMVTSYHYVQKVVLFRNSEISFESVIISSRPSSFLWISVKMKREIR